MNDFLGGLSVSNAMTFEAITGLRSPYMSWATHARYTDVLNEFTTMPDGVGYFLVGSNTRVWQTTQAKFGQLLDNVRINVGSWLDNVCIVCSTCKLM